LYSWQNLLTFLLLLIWTILIAWRMRRTPLEMRMPSLDRDPDAVAATARCELKIFAAAFCG
jgi:hypothetical protein